MSKLQQLDLFVQSLNQEQAEAEEINFNVFEVTDLETAAEAQRRIAYHAEEMNKIDVAIQNQIQPFLDKIERIKAWGEEAKQEYKERQQRYFIMLEAFLREEVAKQQASGKKKIKKSIKLPYGSISLKAQQPQFNKDEAALLEYAKASGYVKEKPVIDWDSIKKNGRIHEGKLYDDNGVEVAGVTVVERDDKFDIKLS